ncbi:MAG: hypothetical protein E7316_08590 [Clostridiales bacterium]|nr:hypothetical protein [Clostridiales bacterium]
MKPYENFGLAAYVYAYYLEGKTEEQIQADIDAFRAVAPLHKAYLETHRALVDIPDDQMLMAKRVFERNGIEVSGGITTTGLVGERKPAIFDCYCYSDDAHREALLDIVRRTARLFDELILDDYYFNSCRCGKCIEQKGERSWAEFKLDQMEEYSRLMVAAAKEANPKCKCIVKFPNWYEAFQECGYNPGKEKDIFDAIYTGTETRMGSYDGQHLQRYLSYGIIRLMENTAPGRNGGGWIDPHGSQTNISRFVQQGTYTVFAKARELMLFNFELMINSPMLGALAAELRRVDKVLSQLGKPNGVSTYEPYDSDGEDQLPGYLGLCGIPMELTPEFDEKAPVLFLTENSTYDQDVMSKLEKYVRNGGVAIVTSGFAKAMADRGIRQMTSVKVTDRKVSGTRYQLTNLNVSTHNVHVADEPVLFTVMQHKNNATWYDVLLHVNEFSTPVMTEDQYGKGFLYILNIPDNYGDLYRLPREVIGAITKNFARKGQLYLTVNPKFSLFTYDNDTFCVYNLNEFKTQAEVTLLGEEYIGIEDLETGVQYTTPVRVNPQPRRMGDSASCRPEPLEKVFELPVGTGDWKCYKLLRK